MFERTEEWLGGSLKGYCKISPAKLIEVFGKPSESDGYKISGEYVFHDKEAGQHFSLYDWKSTTLYDDFEGNTAPTPEQFWASTSPYEFHIGGDGSADLASVIKAIESLETHFIGGGDTCTGIVLEANAGYHARL